MNSKATQPSFSVYYPWTLKIYTYVNMKYMLIAISKVKQFQNKRINNNSKNTVSTLGIYNNQ